MFFSSDVNDVIAYCQSCAKYQMNSRREKITIILVTSNFSFYNNCLNSCKPA